MPLLLPKFVFIFSVRVMASGKSFTHYLVASIDPCAHRRRNEKIKRPKVFLGVIFMFIAFASSCRVSPGLDCVRIRVYEISNICSVILCCVVPIGIVFNLIVSFCVGSRTLHALPLRLDDSTHTPVGPHALFQCSDVPMCVKGRYLFCYPYIRTYRAACYRLSTP